EDAMPRQVMTAVNYRSEHGDDALRAEVSGSPYSRDRELDIRSAPAAPSISFYGEPAFLEVSGTGVYWAETSPNGYDVYRLNRTYYVPYQGYWYRSSSMQGPYYVMYERTVPASVISAVDYRGHHGERMRRRTASRTWEREHHRDRHD